MSKSVETRGRGRPASELKLDRKPTRAQRIAKAIRKLREAERLEVAEAARRADISPSVWYRLERAAVKNLREATLARVSKVFRRTVDDLDSFGFELCAQSN